MKKRINWMDWAKFLAVALVIPVHIPHNHGDMPVTWFEVFLLASLMFNSGYLKKERDNWRENLRKYWYSLVIPYLIYNILFYPFWLVRYYLIHGFMPTHLYVYIKPLVGMLLLQAHNSYAYELNPVTWFIAALVIIHILLDICNSLKYGKWWMAGLCIAGMILYVINKYSIFTNHLVFVGIFKSLVFYYMGYLCRQYGRFKECVFKKDLLWFIVTFIISIVLFYYHANETSFPLHMLSYFPTVLFGMLSLIFFCKMLNNIHSSIVVNYSNGTMVFIGLHWIMTGLIRYGILKPLFHVPTDYIYSPLKAYLLGVVVTILLYPVILFFQAKVPWMLGKRIKPSTEA